MYGGTRGYGACDDEERRHSDEERRVKAAAAATWAGSRTPAPRWWRPPIQTTDTKKGTVKTGSDLRAGRK